MKKFIHLSGILLLISIFFSNGCNEDTPTVLPSEHFEPEGWVLRDATQRPILVVWQGYIKTLWQGNAIYDTLYAPLNALSDHLTVKFLDANQGIMNPPVDADHEFGWSITDTTFFEIIRDNPTDWAFHLKGKKEGKTTLELQVLHIGHVDVRTPKIPVIIRKDITAYGEPVGLRLVYEANGTEIARANESSAAGSLDVQKDSTTDHIEIEFFDDHDRFFQPEYPLHSLNASVGNNTVAQILPEPNEPWVIRIKGLKTGSTTLILKLMVSGSAKFTSYPVSINVN